MALFYTYSGNVYGPASAGQTTFALTSSAGRNIPYLLPAHIHVSTSVNDQQTWVELARPADWNFDAQGTSVVLASPLPVATELRVQRITPTDEPFVDFQASSLLTAEQLNEGEEFSLYVDQELRDAVAIDLAGALIYKGAVDLTVDNAPLNPANGWTLYNTGAGVVIQGGTPGWAGIVGTTIEGGEQVIYNGAQWEIAPERPDGVVVVNGTAPITVDSTDPQRPVIGLPDATGATSGAMSAADKAKLDIISTDVLWTRTGTTLAPETAGDVVEVSAGTAALPGLTPVGDPDTGIYSPGADQWAVATNGVGRLVVDSTGVITTDPGFVLARFNLVNPNSVSTYDRLLILRSGSLSNGFFGVGLDSFYVASATAAPMVFCTNSDGGVAGTSLPTNERMRIDVSGNVGIGTASPQAPFVVSNGGAQGLEIGWDDVSTSQYLQAYNRSGSAWIPLRIQGGDIRFNISGSTNEKARIDSSGRLLVGTPTARSNVYQSALNITPQNQIESNKGDYSGGLGLINCSASGQPAVLTFGQSYTNTLGGNALIANNEFFGLINFTGNDGTNFRTGAQISASVDGTPGANDMPGRLVFSTTASGASSPTERMRIESNGRTKFSGSTYGVETTITTGSFDMAVSNFWTCGAITIPNPTNAVAGMSGLIRLTAAPSGWGGNFSTAPAPTVFPSIVPFYVESATSIRLGQAVGVA